MKAVRVRPMRAGDLDQVMAIAASLKDAPHWTRAAYVVALDTGATPKRIALVAEAAESGAVVGFAVASVVAPQAELESIAVPSEAQRRGIGKYIFLELFDELKTEGVGEVLLEVRTSNDRARGFYRSLGWNEAGRRPRYYADPEEDAVLLSLKLA